MQVRKAIAELQTFSRSRAKNRQLLSGSTKFNRIEIPASQDPLNGNLISKVVGSC